MPSPNVTADPPDHQGHRRLLLPYFSPRNVADLEDALRTYCRELIAAIGDGNRADAAEQYTQHIPVHGICKLTGLPEQDADLFRDWIYRNFQLAPRDNNVRIQVMTEMGDYIGGILEGRQANPRDDMLTMIANAEIEGEPVDWELKVGYVRLLIVAGIDTTWSAIGSGLWHFAQHPDQVTRLIEAEDDMLWQMASEEVLRYYAPVTLARKVLNDTEVSGCPVHAGDQVLLPFPAANHDPEAFANPDEFQLDRARNRHVAFGLGIHRCVGSNLARLELLIALQEWLRAFPDYRLDPEGTVTWANGQVRGPRNIPVLLGN